MKEYSIDKLKDYDGSIVFRGNNKDIMKITPEGDIFVNGGLIENDVEIANGLREFLHSQKKTRNKTCSVNEEKSFSNVERPKHYADKEIEVIDYIKDTLTKEMYEGYCIGNVIKYISRYRGKNGLEDLEKAIVYLGWASQLLKDEDK